MNDVVQNEQRQMHRNYVNQEQWRAFTTADKNPPQLVTLMVQQRHTMDPQSPHLNLKHRF